MHPTAQSPTFAFPQQERIPFARLPQGLTGGLYATQEYLQRAELPPRQLSLIRLLASGLNGCVFCLDMHQAEARATISSQEQLALRAWRHAPYFSQEERILLALTEAMIQPEKGSEIESTFEQTRETFGDERACQYCLAITQIASWNRLSLAFGFQPPSARSDG